MNDLINISVGDAAMTALLGYAVVFIGIIMLMILVMFVGDLMFKSAKRKAAKAPAGAAYPLGEPTILCSRRMKVS